MNDVCTTCGGIIPSDKTYCMNCTDREKQEYMEVKRYIRANPNSNAIQVANATGISISKITRYIRDGMLTKTDSGR